METATARVSRHRDRPSCAAKIRPSVQPTDGVQQVKVYIATQIMTVEMNNLEIVHSIERAVSALTQAQSE